MAIISSRQKSDFWISYTNADRSWADWIAWVVEENGYTSRLQSWDVHLEDEWRTKVKEIEASLENQLSIILFSESFLEKLGTRTKWEPTDGWNRAAFELRKVADRQLKGSLRFLPNSQLISVRVEECQLTGTFKGIQYLDLVGASETEAEKAISKRLEVITGTAIDNSLDNFATVSESSLETVTDSEQFMQKRRSLSVECYLEHLNDELSFEMMRIPVGSFQMGSPENELKHERNEGPQHQVNVPQFFMAKCPVTQAQWQVVAAMPQVNRELKADPSTFKGDDRPVEHVSWYEAVEFCDRISAHTNRPYRLPSEAEWEYACRAGTKTAFHFGKTITTDLANYRGTDDEYGGSGSYGSGPKGEYRRKTTPINHFDIANAYGLCDMHGNVWEWCQDHWHDDYYGAPDDGRAWMTGNDTYRVVRGGSWDVEPEFCRSARRNYILPDGRFEVIGFRVVSAPPPRSLP